MAVNIAWKPFYSVGAPLLDAQHKQIIRIVSELYEALDQGNDAALLEPLLDRLVQYTSAHFKYEEDIMRQHDYPGLAEHKALHDRLRQRTADLRANVSLVTGRDLLRFVKDWWLEHIQGEDKKYAPYLQVPAHS